MTSCFPEGPDSGFPAVETFPSKTAKRFFAPKRKSHCMESPSICQPHLREHSVRVFCALSGAKRPVRKAKSSRSSSAALFPPPASPDSEHCREGFLFFSIPHQKKKSYPNQAPKQNALTQGSAPKLLFPTAAGIFLGKAPHSLLERGGPNVVR